MMANKKLVYIKDPAMLEFIDGLGNFSAWVQDKVQIEMQGGIDPAIIQYINRMMGGRVPAVEIPVTDGEFDVESSGFL